MNFLAKKWVLWLGVMIIIIASGLGLSGLLYAQQYIKLGHTVSILMMVFAMAWLFWGMWQKRELRFIKVTGWYIVSGLSVYFIATLLAAAGYVGGAFSFIGMWCMAVTFVLGLVLIRLLLRPGYAILGVARTLIDEAIRMKVAMVFIVAILLLVPILPIAMSDQERLSYRIQAFLSWSTTATTLLLGLLTMFLACSTIAGEITSKRIFMTMTKPITRLEFILGKWLGILMLNALLLTVMGMTVFVFARTLERSSDDMAERMQVAQQVLVSRTSVQPMPPTDSDFQKRFEQRVEALAQEQSERYGGEIRAGDRTAIMQRIVNEWRTAAPGHVTTFMFSGLEDAKNYSDRMQLRFKVSVLGKAKDDKAHMRFRFNDGPLEQPISVVNDEFYVKDISVKAIDSQGNMKLEVLNNSPPFEQGGLSLNFPTEDGIEVFYRTGTFEGNLARSLVITLAKLSFIAMLGLAASTFLSFPIAVLLTMLVYCTAASSEFLTESLIYFASYSDHVSISDQFKSMFSMMLQYLVQLDFYNLMKVIIRFIGQCFVLVTPAFGRYETVDMLADGKAISWSLTINAVLRIGMLGTGLCGAVGWAIFNKRELARVTV